MTASTWVLLEADARERALFATLAATLQRAGERAAPANRLREVRRITAEGRVWFLKIFHRTQLKNALALRCTEPRAHTEAEREAAMACALRAAGFDAPRPIAVGRHGRSSYFLCAALEGVSLRQRLAQGHARDLLLAVARFAGAALAQGFCLPDLSAEHVFVQEGQDCAPHLAFLDLHNARRGTPSRRTLARALRHGARSLRGLPVTRTLLLRAALTLLRAAGRAPDARALLRALPPWHTHARYDVAGKSLAYHERSAARTRRELGMLHAIWPGQPGERVLDSPCGVGRLATFLAEHDHAPIACDRSRAMLRHAAGYATRAAADAAMLPLADRSVHGAVVFRFLHHLDRTAARAVLAEAARVAERWLVVSVFHPWSLHGAWRRLRRLVTRRGPTRFAHAPAQVSRWLEKEGFAKVAATREGWLRELCVLSCRRRDGG